MHIINIEVSGHTGWLNSYYFIRRLSVMESPVYVIGYRLGVPTLDGVKEVGFRFVFHKRIGILSTIF